MLLNLELNDREESSRSPQANGEATIAGMSASRMLETEEDRLHEINRGFSDLSEKMAFESEQGFCNF